MEDILLLKTTVLAVKIIGTVNIPQNARANTATLRAVTDFLKFANPNVLFAGDGDTQPSFNDTIAEDTIIAKIHVIDAPLLINFSRPQTEIVKWFLKQLRSSRKHIVISNTIGNGDFLQTSIDIYVRGIFIPNQNQVHRLHQPVNRLDYAV